MKNLTNLKSIIDLKSKHATLICWDHIFDIDISVFSTMLFEDF